MRSVERWRRAWREYGEAGCCRRTLQGGLDPTRPRWLGSSGSWSACRSSTVGRTSVGRRLESRR
ncbi:hypothetical protein ACFY0A_42615 [Streptomyces sp. NPDC001698]|uniref:hypothetical protein n=1 Tax=unclassified Streptomyces TaxID=2593676 RepID=UPI00368B8E7C